MSCNKCNKLIMCDSKHKAITVLVDEPAIDASINKMIMVLDHDEDTKETQAYIADKITIESTGRCCGNVIDIRYCPFCGEKLVGDNE